MLFVCFVCLLLSETRSLYIPLDVLELIRNIASNHIFCAHCHHIIVIDSKRRKLRFRRTSALIQGHLDWK